MNNERLLSYDEMRNKLHEVADLYKPNPDFCSIRSLDSMIDDMLKLYRAWWMMKPVTDLAQYLGISPDKEEAGELAARLTCPQSFIDELQEILLLLVDAGAVFGPEDIPYWQRPERAEAGRMMCENHNLNIEWDNLPEKDREPWSRLVALVIFAKKTKKEMKVEKVKLAPTSIKKEEPFVNQVLVKLHETPRAELISAIMGLASNIVELTTEKTDMETFTCAALAVVEEALRVNEGAPECVPAAMVEALYPDWHHNVAGGEQ